ncbi:MAG TPA: MFS transporter [Erysipelotrichaceae bacterium]|nr:MFS transporter [Erysipelotrichaceae bacterium]
MSKNEKLLVLINATYFIAATMSAVFVNVYLYAFTGSINSMTMYAMVRFTMIPLGFFIGGLISRKLSLSTILSLGLLIIISAFAFLLGFNHLFKDNYYLIFLVGLVLGTGEGFYWFSIISLNLQSSSKETRAQFISVMAIFNSASTVVAPFVATMIVRFSDTDSVGYIRIFQVVIVLQIIAALVSRSVKNVYVAKPYTLLDKFNLKIDPQWRYVMYSHFLFGIRDSLLIVLTSILIYNATGGKGSLYGDLLTGFAVLNLIANFAARKMIRRDNRLMMYTYGAFLLFTSTMVLVLMPNMIGAIYFGLVNAIGSPFVANTFNIIMMNALQDYVEEENVFGRIISKEFMLNGGRLLGMASILIFATFIPEPYSLIVAVTFCSSFALILVAYAHKYHKQRDLIKRA